MKKELDQKQLKDLFFKFFREKKHAIIKDFSIVPENDGSEGLFILAGMHPLVPYLMDEKHKEGTRLADCQRCIRTKDIESVGDATHSTFFEMLGNWSLGDYFKKEAIEWSYEFLTSPKYLGLPHDKLWVSVFRGNDIVGKDEESIGYWKALGFSDDRIIPLSEKDNWWAVGENGPCGPDTEVFVDTTGKPCSDHCAPGMCECGRFVEVWNNVFMCYNKTGNQVEELSQKNVDTGLGLERILCTLNGYKSAYETSVLKPIFEELIIKSGRTVNEVNTDEELLKGFRILTDHLRASVVILGDVNPTVPGNQGRSYVLRRLIRRSFRYCSKLNLDVNIWIKTTETVVDLYKEYYPEFERNMSFIMEEMRKESERFSLALSNGTKYFNKYLPEMKKLGLVTGEIAFKLYDTYGFPVEVTIEIAEENNLNVDLVEFEKLIKEHKVISRADTTKAKSGLVEETEETTVFHTITHLLQASLREILGTHVAQKGSNITSERLRFDFSHDNALTKEEIEKVESWVQDKIIKKLPVIREVMSYEEAVKSGALGLFKDRYVEEVSVYTIGENVSKEICRGPHVQNTGDIQGIFKIEKEESCGSGIRRIKAILV